VPRLNDKPGRPFAIIRSSGPGQSPAIAMYGTTQPTPLEEGMPGLRVPSTTTNGLATATVFIATMIRPVYPPIRSEHLGELEEEQTECLITLLRESLAIGEPVEPKNWREGQSRRGRIIYLDPSCNDGKYSLALVVTSRAMSLENYYEIVVPLCSARGDRDASFDVPFQCDEAWEASLRKVLDTREEEMIVLRVADTFTVHRAVIKRVSPEPVADTLMNAAGVQLTIFLDLAVDDEGDEEHDAP
jgi:hypothetical protein